MRICNKIEEALFFLQHILVFPWKRSKQSRRRDAFPSWHLHSGPSPGETLEILPGVVCAIVNQGLFGPYDLAQPTQLQSKACVLPHLRLSGSKRILLWCQVLDFKGFPLESQTLTHVPSRLAQASRKQCDLCSANKDSGVPWQRGHPGKSAPIGVPRSARIGFAFGLLESFQNLETWELKGASRREDIPMPRFSLPQELVVWARWFGGCWVVSHLPSTKAGVQIQIQPTNPNPAKYLIVGFCRNESLDLESLPLARRPSPKPSSRCNPCPARWTGPSDLVFMVVAQGKDSPPIVMVSSARHSLGLEFVGSKRPWGDFESLEGVATVTLPCSTEVTFTWDQPSGAPPPPSLTYLLFLLKQRPSASGMGSSCEVSVHNLQPSVL